MVSPVYRSLMNLDLKFRECTSYVAGKELGEAMRDATKERQIMKEQLLIFKVLSMIIGNVKKNGQTQRARKERTRQKERVITDVNEKQRKTSVQGDGLSVWINMST